jgi:hypothetical protein
MIGEIATWEPHARQALQVMKDGLAALRAAGKGEILD